MRIKPDYNKKPLCYYCNRNEASKESAYIDTKYAVTKSRMIPISVSYFSVDVEIPRCKECEKKHSKSSIPHLICFIIVFLLLGWLFISKGTGWTDKWYTICFGVFIDGFLSLFISYFIATPFRLLINEVFYKGVKDEDDTDSYEPIEKLHKCGFKDNKPDPMMSQGDEIDELEYKNTISSIISNNGCIINR